ncbi:hypothetical protein [Bacillus atrophaeus]|uniref:hypothetical protein n=1 Tax=Bacillus atrophaeus TaxID=1452 RepID=UPI00227EAE2D|nr:hypothetical protein [Bacillus atrophaeus]MCY8466572.1 hypothetical protein [Bacillus atrophaeus]MCY8479032.1 hypothetical protein [Bacillus atrophaeus]
MARERIALVPEEVKKETTLELQIRSGELDTKKYADLSEEEQKKVREILFRIASEKVDPHQGNSVLEFILFGFIRLMNKKVKGLSLTQEDKKIEERLNRILDMHDITNKEKLRSEWLFDYMDYAEKKSEEILQNRQEHVFRKTRITGKAEE